MSRRDDFSETVKRTVAERVGRLCCNPDCRVATSGPQVDPSKTLNVGVASHVTAAAPGGPRYDASLTAEQRSAVENAIWLCQNCGKLVDNDANRFPADLLRAWKVLAENDALQNIGKRRKPADFAAAEQARARQTYAMAIFLLRRVCGTNFKNQNLPPYLLSQDMNNSRPFWRTVQTLGTMDSHGRFQPYTEPSSFNVDDVPALEAAETIAREYISAAVRNRDFQEIKEQFGLPDVGSVQSLLPRQVQ
jgi:hypothetical protein